MRAPLYVLPGIAIFTMYWRKWSNSSRVTYLSFAFTCLLVSCLILFLVYLFTDDGEVAFVMFDNSANWRPSLESTKAAVGHISQELYDEDEQVGASIVIEVGRTSVPKCGRTQCLFFCSFFSSGVSFESVILLIC